MVGEIPLGIHGFLWPPKRWLFGMSEPSTVVFPLNIGMAMAAENPYLDGLFKLIVGTRWAPSSYHSGLSIYFRPCRFGLFHPIQKKIVGAHLVTSSNRIKGTSSRPGAPKIMTNIRFQSWIFDSKINRAWFLDSEPTKPCVSMKSSRPEVDIPIWCSVYTFYTKKKTC